MVPAKVIRNNYDLYYGMVLWTLFTREIYMGLGANNHCLYRGGGRAKASKCFNKTFILKGMIF